MNSEKLSLLIRRFTIAAQAHQTALEEMDEGRANAHAKVISGLYAAIIREGDVVGHEALLVLLEHAPSRDGSGRDTRRPGSCSRRRACAGSGRCRSRRSARSTPRPRSP